MNYLICYIVGAVLTYFVCLCYLGFTRFKLSHKDYMILFWIALGFPILLPIAFVCELPDMTYKFANFIFKKIKMWRNKHDYR